MLREQMPIPQNKGKEKPTYDFRDATSTPRGIFTYMKLFDISEEELNDPNMMILDLGAGLQQELARQAKELGLKSKIVSLDPKLALSLEEDLANIQSSLESKRTARIEARKNLPDNTLAALGQALPFKDSSFDRICALYSVPFYLDNPEDIKINLNEMIRTTKNGGIIKTFPLSNKQREIIKAHLTNVSGIEFYLDLVNEPDPYYREPTDADPDWMLTIKKVKK